MGSLMSAYTTVLADSLCGGSSRKLIAGWWYVDILSFHVEIEDSLTMDH